MTTEKIIENGIEYLVRTDEEGNKFWSKYGRDGLHREGDLPAKEYYSGTKVWFWNDQCHRDTGPAIISYTGECFWYWHDECLDKIRSQKQFESWLKLQIFG